MVESGPNSEPIITARWFMEAGLDPLRRSNYCPNCRTQLDRVHRPIRWRLVGLVGVRVRCYRCSQCGRTVAKRRGWRAG